ncbi:NUDIX domain-containing protein [Lacticaseibacillus baoqingensis]|uniref:NUDIX domain-containing protein n=1 Tax=Lacticaseibacillus baoqingensis TaxID=2486013 RepID=A0ABW4E3J4_9LACO|nr:NUDIX hydrolase [Lacticaseibacillus baoqingensis]
MCEERLLAEETLFAGRVVTLAKQTVALPTGQTAQREVVHTSGSAGVLARQKNRALFVRQWRAPLQQATLELIAGRIEPGEAGLVTAKRELNEEAGLAAQTWRPLTSFYQAAGFSDARCQLFIATNLAPLDHKRPLDADEAVAKVWLTLPEALAAQAAGTICDAKTMIGILHWQLMEAAHG